MKWKFSATLPLLAIGSTLVLATTNHAGADQLITFDDINTGTNGDVFPISNPYAGMPSLMVQAVGTRMITMLVTTGRVSSLRPLQGDH
jgi:hypothetical protein